MDVLTIDGLVVDKQKATASYEGKEKALSKKSIDLLFTLGQANNQTVSRDMLLNDLWPDRVVTDDSLTNLVSVTRSELKWLGCDNVIKTVPKQGYCLVGNLSISNRAGDSSVNVSPSSISLVNNKFVLFVACLLVLFIILKGEGQNKDLKLAILPVNFANPIGDASQNVGDGLLQELQHTATQVKSISVLSRSQVNKQWDETQQFSALKDNLSADYVLESQIRRQGKYLRVTMQWVNTSTNEAIITGAYDVLTEMLESHHSKIWQDISYLFIHKSMYSLNLYEKNKQQAAADLCNSYYQHFLLYKDGFLNGIELIAQEGLDICSQSLALSPNDINAYIQKIALYDVLIKSDLSSNKTRETYFGNIEASINRLKLLPGSELFVAESQLLLIATKLANYAKNIDLEAVYRLSEEIIQSFEHGSITANFARNAAVIRQRHITFLLRQGKKPDDMFRKALSIVDKGLAIEPNNKHLLYTKAVVYFRRAWIAVERGENPTSAYTNAIAYFKSSLMQGDARAVNYDAIANAYSNLAKWQVERGSLELENVIKAEEAYTLAHGLSKTYHRSRNNAADMYSVILWADTHSKLQFDTYMRKAEEKAASALSIKPDYPYPNLVLSQVYFSKAKAELAANSGDLLAVTECAQYFERGAELMAYRGTLFAALAYCQIVETSIHIQQQQWERAEASLAKLSKSVIKIAEADQSGAASYYVRAEHKLLGASLAHVSGKSERALEASESAVDLYQACLAINHSHREAQAGLVKAHLISSLILNKNTSFTESRNALLQFKANYPSDGRGGLFEKLLNRQTLDQEFKQHERESYVQFIRRAALYYYMVPFI